MVDLESNIQMWRALGTKPPVFNRSGAHAEAQASGSCVLVSSEKASHPVSGSGRGSQPQDVLIFKCFSKNNQIFEATELYGKYLMFYSIKGHGRNSVSFREISLISFVKCFLL